MRFNSSQVLTLLLALCSAVALLHVSIALSAGNQFGDSPRTTQTVRSYYASINSFLAGGDPEGSIHLIGNDVAGTGARDDTLMLGAFRATYPDLRLLPGDVSVADDLVLSQVTVVDGEARLPTWINDGVGQSIPDSIDSLLIENGQVVQRQSSARIGVLAHPLVGNGVEFRIDRPSQLRAVEFVLSASSSRESFVAISGPGFVLPLDGAFRVAGNGLLQATDPWSEESSRPLPSGQQTVFSGEEILVIPRGQAVLRPIDHTTVRLMLFAMVPMQSEPGFAEAQVDPQAPDTLEDILRRLSVEDGIEQIWFGHIRVLAIAPNELKPGWLSMDMTRIVVPPGEDVRLSPQGHQLIALVRAEDTWSELEAFELINASGSAQILEAVRACWRGAGDAWQRDCALLAH